jgi:hypothetical protein
MTNRPAFSPNQYLMSQLKHFSLHAQHLNCCQSKVRIKHCSLTILLYFHNVPTICYALKIATIMVVYPRGRVKALHGRPIPLTHARTLFNPHIIGLQFVKVPTCRLSGQH